MCQRLKTGESNNFYFGIFICIGPLIVWHEKLKDFNLETYNSTNRPT